MENNTACARFVKWYNALDADSQTLIAERCDAESGESFEGSAATDWVSSTDATLEDYDTVSEMISAGCVELGDDGIMHNRESEHRDNEVKHADYPHMSGALYDCPVCEATCFCDELNKDISELGHREAGAYEPTVCVHCAIEAEQHSKHTDPNVIEHDNGVRELIESDNAPTTATCGECGRSWDDGKSTSVTPTPAGRCPFESEHSEPEADDEAEHIERCVICGDVIDYCPGHGMSETVQAIYAQHDDGDHAACNKLACPDDEPHHPRSANTGETVSEGEHTSWVLECEDITPSATVSGIDRKQWLPYAGVFATGELAEVQWQAARMVATARAQGVTRAFRLVGIAGYWESTASK